VWKYNKVVSGPVGGKPHKPLGLGNHPLRGNQMKEKNRKYSIHKKEKENYYT
jgi:hypothetical protein